MKTTERSSSSSSSPERPSSSKKRKLSNDDDDLQNKFNLLKLENEEFKKIIQKQKTAICDQALINVDLKDEKQKLIVDHEKKVEEIEAELKKLRCSSTKLTDSEKLVAKHQSTINSLTVQLVVAQNSEEELKSKINQLMQKQVMASSAEVGESNRAVPRFRFVTLDEIRDGSTIPAEALACTITTFKGIRVRRDGGGDKFLRIDEILNELPNIQDFEVNAFYSSADDFKKLIELPLLPELQTFTLTSVSPLFNLEAFGKFIKRYPRVQFTLKYDKMCSGDKKEVMAKEAKLLRSMLSHCKVIIEY